MMLARVVLILTIFVTPQLDAHHSTSLNFSDERVAIEGRIAAVNWVNPHCSFVVEVSDDLGVTERWLVEMLARIALERQGFDFEALEVGQTVSVVGRLGYRPNSLYFVEAQLPDGRVLRDPGPIR